MSKMDEVIVVAPRRAIFAQESQVFQGLLREKTQVKAVLRILDAEARLMRRGDAESDPAYKQPIPYLMITRAGEEGLEVFAYERLAASGEQRLRGKLSLGVGGHLGLDRVNGSFLAALRVEALRELEEEVEIGDGNYRVAETEPHILALINDDSDEVGRVHIGVLGRLHLDAGTRVCVRETEQLAGRWYLLGELRDSRTWDRLEGWSRFALEALSS